jgi:LacI family transcriptional regulator
MHKRAIIDKKIRIKDIASLVGVSHGTVDRVIHNRGDVSETTRKKILNALNDRGYKPNIIARALTSKKQYTFASLLPLADSEYMYWQLPLEGILKAENELSSFHISIQQFFYSVNSEESFENEAKKIYDLMPDGVILAPCLIKQANNFINVLNSFSIPYILIDTSISVPNAAFIGENAFQSGRVGAHLIDRMTDESDKIAIVNIVPDLINIGHIHQRNLGFRNYFELKNTYREIITIEINSINNIPDKLHYYFIPEAKIKAVFVANSKTFMVADYFAKNNIQNIRIVGYDLIERNIKFLQSGMIDFLLSQQPNQQGYIAVTTLYHQIVLGQKPISIQYIPIDIISSENLDFYK